MGYGGVSVLGLGNVLMGDDAFGPFVVKVLEASWRFPADVELAEVGTPGHDLSLYMEGRRALVLVDALDASGEPGDLRFCGLEEIVRRAPCGPLCAHEPGLREALLALEFAGNAPGAVHLVGVVAARLGAGEALSGPVRAAVPRAADAVVRRLADLGVPVYPRVPPARPDIWWER